MTQATENLLYDIGPLGATLAMCAVIVLTKCALAWCERVVIKAATTNRVAYQKRENSTHNRRVQK